MNAKYTTVPPDLRGKSDPDDLWIKAQLIRIDPSIEDHDTEHSVANAMRKLVLEQRDQLANTKPTPEQMEELEDRCAGMALALRGAREFINHDRETVIQGCTVDDVFMPDDQSARAIAEYDAILADIDAALPPNPAPAVVHLPSDDTEGGEQ